MIRQGIAVAVIFLALYAAPLAQLPCEQFALNDINLSIETLGHDVNLLLARFNAIERIFRECKTRDALPNLSTAELIDGGYVDEGLWHVRLAYTWSALCEGGEEYITSEFYEDLHYNSDGLLIWDDGDPLAKYHFEDLLARRLVETEPSGEIWVNEYLITAATNRTIAGSYSGYWQEKKDEDCTVDGAFTSSLVDAEHPCIVYGFGNAVIRTLPSERGAENGVVDGQRQVFDKVPGAEGYYWWRLSDDEYVREGAISASNSCSQL